MGVPQRVFALQIPIPHAVHVWLDCGNGTEGNPSWSPDGNRIVFSQGIGDTDTQLVVLDVRTGRRTVITHFDCKDADYPAWLPDGTAILFSSARGLMIVRPDGAGLRTLVRGSTVFGEAWSPDGSRIVYSRGSYPYLDPTEGVRAAVYVIPRDGSARRKLAATDVSPGSPAWAPATEIAFPTYYGVALLQSPSGSPHHIGTRVIPDSVTWSADANVLLVGLGDRLFVMTKRGQEVRTLYRARSDAAVVGGAFSPDGAGVAFSISASGAQGIYIARSDGTHRRKLVSY